MKIEYRPEIDGLRTIAVLAVIIYHAEIFYGKTQLLKGGYLGVDVFFVISGFLITSIIMGEYQKTGKFSIANFYERRARRLLPALFLVIFSSLPFAWHILLPAQLVDFSKSILSSLAFASNIYWHQTLQEYDAESALLQPFLHTWSLAVEEQYYIFYPLILIALHRWLKIHAITILTALLLLSLQYSEITTKNDPSFSFYMLPSRFWELLFGGLLANILYFHPQKDNDALLNKTMPVLGLFLVAYALLFIDFDSSHPGFVTLLPVAGTVLIIWFANKNDLVTKLLSTRVFVSIGLISYSLYLWHYPIFAFGRYLESTPGWEDKTKWVSLTFILSVATYLLVEKPFRNKRVISRKALLSLLAGALIATSSINAYWLINDGFDDRLGYLRSVLESAGRIWVTKDGQKCHSGGGARTPEFTLNESCVFTYGENDKYIISLGDSHAGSLSENLRILAEANSYNFIQLTSAGCPHVKGGAKNVCDQRGNQLANYLAKYPDSIVVYSARFPFYLEVERFVNEEGEKEDNYKPFPQEFKTRMFATRSKAFVSMLEELKHVIGKLVIVYPVPEQGFHVRDKLFRKFRLAMDKESLPIITTSYDRFKARANRSYEVLDSVSGDNIFRVYPEKIFCHEESGRCMVSDKDRIFYSGDNHVSPLGSSLIVSMIADVLGLTENPFKTPL